MTAQKTRSVKWSLVPEHTVQRHKDVADAFSADPSVLLTELLRAAAAMGEAESAHLWLHDRATSTYRPVCATGTSHRMLAPVRASDEPMRSAVLERHGVLSERASHESAWRYSVPLGTGSGTGAMVVDFCGERPDPRQLAHLAEAYGQRMAAALEVHIARSESTASAVLVRAARALLGSSTVDTPSLLLDHALALSGAATASVMVLGNDGARLTIAASHGLPDDVVESTSVGHGEGVAGWVLATSKPVVIEDEPGRGTTGRRHGVTTALSVPVCHESRCIGVLNVGYRTYPGRSLDGLLAALQELCDIAATPLATRRTPLGKGACLDTLQALVSALESRDPYAQGATVRIAELTARLGAVLGLTPEESDALRAASLLHDIGMDAVGDAVTGSNRPLSTVERTLLKMHPSIGSDLLRQAPSLDPVVPIVYHHHERYDGTGYVSGLAGERIPLAARILAVADAFVAMTSDRPYRHARSDEEALEEVRLHAGTQFDPAVVKALEETVAQKH